MSARFPSALVVGAVLAFPAFADPPKKPDPTAELLAKLAKPVDLDKIDDASLGDFAEYLEQKFGVAAVVNEKAFKEISDGEGKELRVKVGNRKGLPLGTNLRQILDRHDAAYLVRRGHIEIVPVAFAVRETKNNGAGEGEVMRPREPLVSVIVREKALNDALAELAEEYDLNVVVAPQSGDARTGFVTARLLNVPADKAIELLAIQADLRVVRKGTAYLVTSRDHAGEMFGERLEKERQRIEVEKLREAPPAQPPAPAPEPKQDR